MHRLISAEPSSDYILRLLYADSASFEVDIRPLIDKGGVFAPLADRALFAQVRIGEGGRYVEWPGEVDLCADALRLEGQTDVHDQRSSSAQ
ncbi:MAG: DUF2442 domain-containing protein [Pirellulales bacterium]